MEKAEEKRWTIRADTDQTDAAYETPLAEPPRGIYVLAHGAGGDMNARNLLRESRIIRELGFGVARFNFFYRAARRSYPDKMPQLIACYRAVIDSIADHVGAGLQTAPVFIGGHSMGGRAATMLAAEGFHCAGLILFSYPLHPPGKFDQLRSEHLPRIAAPVLCFNGTRDDFMRRDLMDKLLPTLPKSWTHHWIDHADHSLNVLKKSGRTATDVDKEVADSIQQWLQATR